YTASKTSFNCSNLGINNVILTVTDASGNSNTANAIVTVKDNLVPVITTVANQIFCTGSISYMIPVLNATDNCSLVTVSYTISGATTRTGTTNNASGSFNTGLSTINWTVKDGSNNITYSSTTVTINALPAAALMVSDADAFCNKLTLTAVSGGSGATYKWMSGSIPVATTQQISLGQANGDGIYQLYVTVDGCTSAAAGYNFQKQNLVSSYTILAFDKIDLGLNNMVNSGSVGVTSNSGEAEFGSNSSVSSAGSFVKAKRIDKNGSNIIITNPIYSPASGIVLPTMLLNTASTNGLPNKDVAQNSVSTVIGNYKNLTLKKGSRTTLTGNIFGTIRVEQGAQVTFTAGVINIDNLQVVKGPRYGYSYVRFAGDTKMLVSTSVTIGSQVYINPDNHKVTFYLGDKKSDEEKFTVNGGDTKVSANIYVPNGKLKVTGGYRYGDYGNGNGDCDRDDDEDKYYGQGNAYVNMTGLFVAEKVEGNGRNVIWNSFDCSAAPVPVLNTTITQSLNTGKETITTSEEELKVTVLPNPSTTYFSLKIESKYATPVSLRVMDGRGRVVDAKSKVGSNSTIQIGHNYASGTYYAEMIQGTQRKMVQLIKARG
ncbi:MAG: T9SS type A sorting domain-containing protein, partial [Sediminibacterium sp.]